MILKIGAALMVCIAAYAQMPGYGGPGVSTRGRQMGSRGSDPVSIRPFATLLGVADNGLTPVSLAQTGEILNPGTLYGVEASVGAYGTKSWRRNQLGLDYQGSYRHYSSKTFFNGSDQLLGLDYSTQVNRRTGFRLRTMAGTTSRTTGGTFGAGLFDPLAMGTSFNDIFDNRAYFLDVSGDLSLQVGSRNSVALGGNGFAVRRQSAALVGLNGHRAFGAFSRQVNRTTSLGLSYQYMHVDYPRVFGEADVHTLMLQISRQIGRRWNLSLGGGAFRTDFVGVRQVAVDPVVAELFGVTTGREAFNSISTASAMSVALGRNFRRGAFGVGYNRGANPGNGAILLNRSEVFSVTYSYNTGFKWAFSTFANLSRFSGFGIYNDRLSSYNGSIMANRQLSDDLHFTAGVDVRRFNVNANSFQRLSTRVMVGLTYSPGEIPVSLR